MSPRIGIPVRGEFFPRSKPFPSFGAFLLLYHVQASCLSIEAAAGERSEGRPVSLFLRGNLAKVVCRLRPKETQ